MATKKSPAKKKVATKVVKKVPTKKAVKKVAAKKVVKKVVTKKPAKKVVKKVAAKKAPAKKPAKKPTAKKSISKSTKVDQYGLEKDEQDVLDIDHIIEVDEQEMLISLYSYVPIPVPDKLIGALGLAILNINPETRYGSLELCTTENEEGATEHFLRYRAATYLRGIKSGKVEAIESMVTNGSEFFGLALDAMCVNKSIKKWLLS